MKNTEKLATQGIRDEEEHRTNEKYRETGNTGYTETKKNTGQMKNTEKLATQGIRRRRRTQDK